MNNYILMKKIVQKLSVVTLTLLLLGACKQKQSGDIIIQQINISGQEAVDPYFTKDNKGNPVLCWTEKDSSDSLYRLKYAIYNDQSGSFGPAVTVSVSKGMSPTAESMGKVAFKSDGTVLAVFGKRFPDEKNPFAGAICYTISSNEGKSWSQPQYLHSDTAHTYGRSFFDIANLDDGELASVWLDNRYGKQIKGSALFFSRTEKGKGFGKDTCLAKGTCECCRTDLLMDSSNNMHIAYRNITFPTQMLGKQVRDMAYIVSKDNGKTFSQTKTISKDNWAIEGCPHSGPSLAVTQNTVNAVWFTAGGSPGIYFASYNGSRPDFAPRNLIAASGRHPQMVTLFEKTLAIICEETAQEYHQPAMPKTGGKGMMMMKHAPASDARIMLRILKSDTKGEPLAITDGKQPDHHAVLTTANNGLLIAWIREKNGGSQICYSRVDTE